MTQDEVYTRATLGTLVLIAELQLDKIEKLEARVKELESKKHVSAITGSVSSAER